MDRVRRNPRLEGCIGAGALDLWPSRPRFSGMSGMAHHCRKLLCNRCGFCNEVRKAETDQVYHQGGRRHFMKHENGKSPSHHGDVKKWSERVAVRIAERALPEGFPADLAERFEVGWRKSLKRLVPRAWPQSFQKRLLGTVYIEFMERLRGEDAQQQLVESVHFKIENELSLGRAKHEVLKDARVYAVQQAEALLSPILEGALEEASARLQGEIGATRDEIRRIHLLSPLELHQFVGQYKWDDGYVHLFEVIRSRNCALGTAIMIYWRGRPHLLRQYDKRTEVPNYAIDNFDLLMRIEKKINRNGFKHHGIAYDPREDGGDLTRAIHPMGKKDLPESVYLVTTVDSVERFAPPPLVQSKSYWTGRKPGGGTAQAAG